METLLSEPLWGPDAWVLVERREGLGVVCDIRLTPQSEGLRKVTTLPRSLAPAGRLADMVTTVTAEDGSDVETSRVRFDGPDLLIGGTPGVELTMTIGWS